MLNRPYTVCIRLDFTGLHVVEMADVIWLLYSHGYCLKRRSVHVTGERLNEGGFKFVPLI